VVGSIEVVSPAPGISPLLRTRPWTFAVALTNRFQAHRNYSIRAETWAQSWFPVIDSVLPFSLYDPIGSDLHSPESIVDRTTWVGDQRAVQSSSVFFRDQEVPCAMTMDAIATRIAVDRPSDELTNDLRTVQSVSPDS
jgi:hypothetical protein